MKMSKLKISEDILRIKDLIGAPRKVRVRDSKEEFLIQLKELGHKVEEIEQKMNKEESSINLKRKTQMIQLLKRTEMTPSEVGGKLGMSRSRANQYLKVMEKEGIIRGTSKGKKKFYRVIKEGA